MKKNYAHFRWIFPLILSDDHRIYTWAQYLPPLEPQNKNAVSDNWKVSAVEEYQWHQQLNSLDTQLSKGDGVYFSSLIRYATFVLLRTGL